MKSFVVFLMAVASTLGSGPYLPSGWKPDGPAFLLPTEVEKAPVSPQKEVSESEVSSSDVLQEYGPPEVLNIYQAVTNQALPDLFTEKAFAAIDVRVSQDQNIIVESEVIDQVRSNVFESVDAKIDEVNAIESDEGLEGIGDLDSEDESTPSVEGATETALGVRFGSEETVSTEAALSVATESVTQDDSINDKEVVIELRTAIEEGSGTLSQVPEPERAGFREYGPPKNGEKKPESRRRRFSSKHATVNKH